MGLDDLEDQTQMQQDDICFYSLSKKLTLQITMMIMIQKKNFFKTEDKSLNEYLNYTEVPLI